MTSAVHQKCYCTKSCCWRVIANYNGQFPNHHQRPVQRRGVGTSCISDSSPGSSVVDSTTGPLETSNRTPWTIPGSTIAPQPIARHTHRYLWFLSSCRNRMTRYRTIATTLSPQTSRQIIWPWQKIHALAMKDWRQKVWRSFNAENSVLAYMMQ